MGEIRFVSTVTVDEHNRVVIPEAKPGQVFACQKTGEGELTLTVVDAGLAQSRPFNPHLYDDLDADRLALEQELEAASAKVDVSAEERDRK